jgi:hypothetical protein
MPQRYVNKYDSLQQLDVENLLDCTKNYSKPQLLQYLKDNYGATGTTVAVQLELYAKAKNKLPDWVNAGCLFTRKSLEQSSSEALAAFKAGMMSGHTLIDLSGGLGVDDVAFSRQFEEVVSIDTDEDLNEIARFNFDKLGITNITRVHARAEEYIKQVKERVHVFYADADRRPEEGKRVVTLAGATPDVVAMMPELLEKSYMVFLKLSPMIDLKLLQNTFSHLLYVYVIGLKNEVKEVLAVLNKDARVPYISAVEVDLNGKKVHRFDSSAKPAELKPEYGKAHYFYEPSNMIIKAGLTVNYANYTGAKLVHKNSHYMLSGELIEGYFGRSFSIVHHADFSKSSVKKYLEQKGILKANVSARNFVTSVDEVRKTFGIEDGGDEYLFFTTDAARNKLFWHCRKAQ